MNVTRDYKDLWLKINFKILEKLLLNVKYGVVNFSLVNSQLLKMETEQLCLNNFFYYIVKMEYFRVEQDCNPTDTQYYIYRRYIFK